MFEWQEFGYFYWEGRSDAEMRDVLERGAEAAFLRFPGAFKPDDVPVEEYEELTAKLAAGPEAAAKPADPPPVEDIGEDVGF